MDVAHSLLLLGTSPAHTGAFTQETLWTAFQPPTHLSRPFSKTKIQAQLLLSLATVSTTVHPRSRQTQIQEWQQKHGQLLGYAGRCSAALAPGCCLRMTPSHNLAPVGMPDKRLLSGSQFAKLNKQLSQRQLSPPQFGWFFWVTSSLQNRSLRHKKHKMNPTHSFAKVRVPHGSCTVPLLWGTITALQPSTKCRPLATPRPASRCRSRASCRALAFSLSAPPWSPPSALRSLSTSLAMLISVSLAQFYDTCMFVNTDIYIYICRCMYIVHLRTLHYSTVHYITLSYITLHYITLHYITLHHITSHYINLHYITSTYIHYIHIIPYHSRPCKTIPFTYIHTYLHTYSTYIT